MNRGIVLPWGAQKERSSAGHHLEMDLRPGEFVMRNLFADFTLIAEKKIELVMTEPQVRYFTKCSVFQNIIFLIFRKNRYQNLYKGEKTHNLINYLVPLDQ